MTVNVLLVGGKGYLSSQLMKCVWANFHIFDPNSISSKSDWNLFDQLLQNQDFVLYLHHPSRKNFEVNSSDYIKSAITTAEKVLSRVQHLSNAKVIFTGSYWQDLNETGQNSRDGYSQAKQVVQEFIATIFSSNHRSASLHLFDIYGPDDNRKKLIPLLIRNWRAGTITQINNPESTFAPIHVYDVIEAIRIESEEKTNPNFHIHSIPPNEILSVKEFIQIFSRIFPESKVEINSKKIFDNPQSLSVHSQLPNWSPQIDLVSGLQELRRLHS
jgi:nucleoside-diphosphate-sugar epimerase